MSTFDPSRDPESGAATSGGSAGLDELDALLARLRAMASDAGGSTPSAPESAVQPAETPAPTAPTPGIQPTAAFPGPPSVIAQPSAVHSPAVQSPVVADGPGLDSPSAELPSVESRATVSRRADQPDLVATPVAPEVTPVAASPAAGPSKAIPSEPIPSEQIPPQAGPSVVSPAAPRGLDPALIAAVTSNLDPTGRPSVPESAPSMGTGNANSVPSVAAVEPEPAEPLAVDRVLASRPRFDPEVASTPPDEMPIAAQSRNADWFGDSDIFGSIYVGDSDTGPIEVVRGNALGSASTIPVPFDPVPLNERLAAALGPSADGTQARRETTATVPAVRPRATSASLNAPGDSPIEPLEPLGAYLEQRPRRPGAGRVAMLVSAVIAAVLGALIWAAFARGGSDAPTASPSSKPTSATPSGSASKAASTSPSTNSAGVPTNAILCAGGRVSGLKVAINSRATTCRLGTGVRSAYVKAGKKAGTYSVAHTSSGKKYAMSCSGSKPVVCKGTANSKVYLY